MIGGPDAPAARAHARIPARRPQLRLARRRDPIPVADCGVVTWITTTTPSRRRCTRSGCRARGSGRPTRSSCRRPSSAPTDQPSRAVRDRSRQFGWDRLLDREMRDSLVAIHRTADAAAMLCGRSGAPRDCRHVRRRQRPGRGRAPRIIGDEAAKTEWLAGEDRQPKPHLEPARRTDAGAHAVPLASVFAPPILRSWSPRHAPVPTIGASCCTRVQPEEAGTGRGTRMSTTCCTRRRQVDLRSVRGPRFSPSLVMFHIGSPSPRRRYSPSTPPVVDGYQ